MRPIPLSVIVTWPTPNYINPATHGYSIIIVSSILLFFATVLVVLRLYTRTFVKRWFGWDDVFIIPALVCSIGLSITVGIATIKFGWDRHIWDIPLTLLQKNGEAAFATKLLYILSATFTRCSLICFYYRLVRRSNLTHFHWYLHASLVFTILTSLAAIFTSIFSCTPVRAYWTWPMIPTATCVNEGAALFSISVLHNVCDFLVAILPVPIMARIQMQRRKRIGVLLLLSVGVLANVAGAVRTYYTWRMFFVEWDQSWVGYNLYLASAVEVNLGVICASIPPCNPLLRPLVTRVFGFVTSLSTRGRTSSSSSSTANSNENENSVKSHSIVPDTGRKEKMSHEESFTGTV